MLRLKTLRLAGVAALLSCGGAFAADMIGQPPPPPPLIQAPPPVDVGGGFYLRGDVGLGYQDYKRLDLVPPLAGSSTLSNSLDAAWIVGIGAGYQFNPWLRTDATLEYRSAARFRVFEESLQGTPAGSSPSGYNHLTGKVSALVGLANAYVDLGTWHRITPFIGAGVGFASIKTDDVVDRGYGAFNGGYGTAASRTKTNFAWAIHAGLGYDLSSNWKAEVGYRYLNMGTVDTANVNCTVACSPFNGRIKDLTSHDIRFGLRYVFAEAVPVLPGPLMRKY